MAEGQDPTDITSELDPDRDCDYFTFTINGTKAIQKFEALSSCKDNCKGGKLNKPYDDVLGAAQLTRLVKKCVKGY